MQHQPPPLKLYYTPLTCALSCHIALEESGLAYDSSPINILAGENREADYLAINPTGKVPALMIGSHTVLTEAHAILTYIGEQAPAHRLIPEAGTLARARAHEWMSFIASTVHIAFRSIFRPALLAGPGVDEEAVRQFGRDRVGQVMGDIERRLEGNIYALGDHFSVCDAYLFVCYAWSHVELVGSTSPAGQRFHALAERLWQRPAIQKVADKEGITTILPF